MASYRVSFQSVVVTPGESVPAPVPGDAARLGIGAKTSAAMHSAPPQVRADGEPHGLPHAHRRAAASSCRLSHALSATSSVPVSCTGNRPPGCSR